MSTRRTSVDRPYVLVAFVLQVLGYAALVAVSTHAGPTKLVAVVGRQTTAGSAPTGI